MAHYDAKLKPVLDARQQRIRQRVLNQDYRNVDRNLDDDPAEYGFDDSESVYADDGGGPTPLDKLFR